MPHRLFLALLLLSANAASAQVATFGTKTQPVGYLSLAAGFLRADPMLDASTDAVWDFGGALQFRGSVEYAIRNNSAFGAAGTYARVPMKYSDRGGLLSQCMRCDASATVWTALAFFRAGGGEGFHQILEIGAGATGYQDFETDDGRTLPPLEPDLDFSLGVGYGFGYGFGKRLSIFIVQSADQSLHQRGGSSSEGTSFVQHYVTRLGMRYGFGSRRSF